MIPRFNSALFLGGNQLTGTIPTMLGTMDKLTWLTWLTLQGNNLNGPIPSELGKCRQMEAMDLRNAQLTGSIPRELGDLDQLQMLLLSENALTSSIPSELASNARLRFLSLANNQLTGRIPKFSFSSAVDLSMLEDPLEFNAGLILPSQEAFLNFWVTNCRHWRWNPTS